MKKQSGFTLIELLLVLAIIGIISAIAIPALLGQRARARDKSAISNMDGRVGDLVGQYDKFKEAGLTNASIQTSLGNYLTNTGGADKNPWNAANTAFDFTVHKVTGATNQSTAIANFKSAVTSLGVATFGIQFPTGGTNGFIVGGVKISGVVNGSSIVTKATAIE